jgi:hypothetical protein
LAPANEVLISFPVTIGQSASVFFGAMRETHEPMLYMLHVPVTTEIAVSGGVEFYGYPKFIAEIEFMRADGWIHCHVAADGRDILTLSGRQIVTKPAQRMRVHNITVKEGRILRAEGIINPRQLGISRRSSEVRLELGNHPIADELRGLHLGRVFQLQFMPKYQSILSYAIESYAA